MTPPGIATEHLILRPAEAADFPYAAAAWSDPEVVRFIGGKVRTPQEVWFSILRGRGMWDLKGFGYWSVIDRQTGEWLGEAGFADFLRGLTPDLSDWPESGWAFARAAWGRGVASEAVKAAHDWLDRTRSGQSVCIIEPENAASLRVAEKCGYEFWCHSEIGDAMVSVFRRNPDQPA